MNGSHRLVSDRHFGKTGIAVGPIGHVLAETTGTAPVEGSGGMNRMVRPAPGAVERGVRAAFGAGTVSGLTDAELLDRFCGRRDDGASFEALVARHGPMVLGVCRDILGDEHAADDAFQATFLVLVRKAGSVRLRTGDSLGRWLYGVAHRVARHARADVARRRRRERERAGEADTGGAGTDPGASPGDAAERADLRAMLHEELTRLPEPFRAAIVLCHLEGLSHEEAALRLRWPIGTVRSRLARGRERLRGRLARRGAAPEVALAALPAGAPAAVPARLAALTVAAARLVSGPAVAPGAAAAGAGVVSASVLALSKGVALSMTLGPIKLAAAGLLAAGLLTTAATGVLTQPNAAAQAPTPKPDPTPSGDVASPATTQDIPERIDLLRKELTDDLRQRIEMANRLLDVGRPEAAQQILRSNRAIRPPEPDRPPTPADPAAKRATPPEAIPDAVPKRPEFTPDAVPKRPEFTPDAVPKRPEPTPELPVANSRPRSSPAPGDVADRDHSVASTASREPEAQYIQELEVQYKSAVRRYNSMVPQFRNQILGPSALAEGFDRIETVRGQIAGQADRYRDDLELLEVRLKRADAELQKAKAQVEMAASQVGVHKRLNERTKGAVSYEEMKTSEAAVQIAHAALQASEADRLEIVTLIRQTERRLDRLSKFLKENRLPDFGSISPNPPAPGTSRR
jgi:RNA polymerase sigma factor (sigma-70 family)